MEDDIVQEDKNQNVIESEPIIDDEVDWLHVAKVCYEESTSYLDNNYRTQFENNIRHFRGKHANGSKYLKEAYKYRSKIFRPKLRAAARNLEAAAVAAFFANQNFMNIEPMDPMDDVQNASADINMELLSYRLNVSIPWFLTCIGALQDSFVNGVCVSFQEWEYKAKTIESNILEGSGESQVKVISDKPTVTLEPIENIRFHPACDWRDPVNSSPYLIRMIPMYVMDVKARMKENNWKSGQTRWKELSDSEIVSAIKQNYDSTRMARTDDKEDKFKDSAQTPELEPFDIVWVHQNFVRWEDGEDYIYFTLGTQHILSDPIPIIEMYWHGERPCVIGRAIVEAHNPIPQSHAEISENILNEINENANQRLDNVKLVLNKRYFVKRGSQVDLQSLVRNVAGSITLMTDTGDVVPVDYRDVTQSSYQEQDRLNLDFDDIIGTFSQSSVQSNRNLNETVGGMTMLRGNSNALTEYSLKTFAETWAEKVLRQIMKLEQFYESDPAVLTLAGKKVKLWQRYNIDTFTDSLLKQDLTCTIDIGTGATDPVFRLNKLMAAISSVLNVIKNTPPESPLDVNEVIKEIFAYAGYKNGAKFLIQAETEDGEQPDPEKVEMAKAIQDLQNVINQLQAAIQTKQIETQGKIGIENLKQQSEDRRTAMKIKAGLMEKQMDLENPVSGEVLPHGY